jgi:hypothetical protein
VSSIVLLLTIAGSVFGVALLMALIVWSVRIRRAEGNFVTTPDWMKKGPEESLDSPAPIRESPSIIEVESPIRNFLRETVPELSTAVDLGKIVQMAEAAGEKPGSAEERKAIIYKAVNEMLEQQPENEFLRAVLDSLQIDEDQPEETSSQDRIIIQIPGRNLIHVDGVEYYSVADIPDPEMREEVRHILASLNENNSS